MLHLVPEPLCPAANHAVPEPKEKVLMGSVGKENSDITKGYEALGQSQQRAGIRLAGVLCTARSDAV